VTAEDHEPGPATPDDPDAPRRNEKVAAAVKEHAASVRQFARIVGYSPHMVSKWINDDSVGPHRSNLPRIAEGVGLSEAEVMSWFPKFDTQPRPARRTTFTGWQAQGEIPAHEWAALLDGQDNGTPSRVWVFDYAPTTMLAAIEDLPDRLAALHANGADVRVLLADPASRALADLQRHIQSPDKMPDRAARAIAQLRPLHGTGTLRLHVAPLPTTSIAVDGTWWTSTAILTRSPEAWPVHVLDERHHTLTDAHEAIFKALWNSAVPI